uniref:Uncharacterized protein n=1 Tax=Romanomermis culicivorax TaxID=13658 RepID=A0A915I6S6_ROMCU
MHDFAIISVRFEITEIENASPNSYSKKKYAIFKVQFEYIGANVLKNNNWGLKQFEDLQKFSFFKARDQAVNQKSTLLLASMFCRSFNQICICGAVLVCKQVHTKMVSVNKSKDRLPMALEK